MKMGCNNGDNIATYYITNGCMAFNPAIATRNRVGGFFAQYVDINTDVCFST